MCLRSSPATHVDTRVTSEAQSVSPCPALSSMPHPEARLLFSEVTKPLLKYFLHPSSGLPYLP